MKQLLTPAQLHDYQKECVLHGLFNDDAMFWLQMGLGKEQPISEPVLTMGGWVPIGEISPGDYVIGSDGTPTEVHRVYPQGVKEVVKVAFSDGTYTRCGWDHLWAVYSEHQRFKGLPHTVKSLRDLVEGGLTKKNGKNDDMFKWSIPIVEPVNYFNPQQLKIDPYTLGVILGDGSVSEDSGVTVCTDTSILESIGASSIKPHETSPYTSYGYIKGIKQLIRDLGLMGKRSWEKFVPSEYLLASVDQRLALLQGLLDTDGSPIDKGGVEFSSTSENLIDAVINITQSLGGIARSKSSRVTKYQGGEGRESWRVNVKLPSQFTPFRCERKLSRWVRPTKYQPMRKIVGVEVVGVEESVCISVAASDSLYVTRNFIVTHNTPISLTILVDRMRSGQVKKCLIFGPLRVIQSVWARECRKWEHTKHLRCSVLHGVKEKRTRALFADADIFLCNYENMNWLAETLDHYYTSQGKELPFEMVIYDEVSKLKNSTTKRMGGGKRDRTDRWGTTHTVKVIGWRKMIDKFKYRIGLTGTPASNGYLDLHGQYLAVDGGKRLGEYITHYKDSYFVSDYMGWGHTPTEEGKQWIEHHIADITKKMDAKDYLDMPAVTVTNVMVELPAAARKAYAEVEKNLFTTLDSGNEIEIFSKSSISNKCLQFCNGSPYLSSQSPEFDALHDAKLEALEDIIEEAAGRPVLCSYTFKSDAERIMKRFKSLHPVNLTATPSSKTESVVNDWNAGKIKLLVGHPACLHPSTQVLTKHRGWVKIVDVLISDQVFDGSEFVSHNGCSYSGYKEIVDVFGIQMTLNHQLLIDEKWVIGNDVRTNSEAREKALYTYEGDDPRLSEMLSMSNSVRDNSPEFHKTQPTEKNPLQSLCRGSLPQYDGCKDLANMVRNAESCNGPTRQRLSGSWYWVNTKMDGFCKFLRRHVERILGRFNNRTYRCEQGLQQGKLQVDHCVRSTIEQKNHTTINLQWCRNALSRSVSSIWCKQDENGNEIKSGNDCGSSRNGCESVTLRKKAHVYDLVDCGPRHRFLVRNDAGEMFISHNSMGHGIDGLQDSGSIMVWFGLNWSLELYDQMNGRLDRQGQKNPVSIIRILCADTVDLAVADAIERKTDDQEGLKSALDRYRKGITTNDLAVNFF